MEHDGARRGKGKGIVADAVGNLLPEQQQMQQRQQLHTVAADKAVRRKLVVAEVEAAFMRRCLEALVAEQLAAGVELAAALAETEAEGVPGGL